MPAFDELVNIIALGYPNDRSQLAEKADEAIKGLFGQRYRKDTPYAKRIAFMPGDENVPFAGLVHRDSPSSGMYGGMSLIWFPVERWRKSAIFFVDFCLWHTRFRPRRSNLRATRACPPFTCHAKTTESAGRRRCLD